MTENQALVDYWNDVERGIRDLKRIQKKAIDRTLPGIYSLIQSRIDRMNREREQTFMGAGKAMQFPHDPHPRFTDLTLRVAGGADV